MSKPLTMTVEQEKADRAASRFMDRCGMAEADSADAAALRAWTEVDALRAALAAAEAKLADERRHADELAAVARQVVRDCCGASGCGASEPCHESELALAHDARRAKEAAE